MFWLLLAVLAICQTTGLFSNVITSSAFLKDPLPNFNIPEISSHLHKTVVPTLVTEASNGSYVLIGSAGGVFGSPLETESINLHNFKFPALSCPSGRDSSCYQATRIFQNPPKTGRWFVCASKENELDIQRYEFVNKQGLQELELGKSLQSSFYCPYHGSSYMAVDLPVANKRFGSSIIFKERKPVFQIDKIDSEKNIATITSTRVQEKLIRTIGEYQYKDEIWFLYVVSGTNQEGPVAKIARVCTKDTGYRTEGLFAVNLWTSLAYLRLECVIPGIPDFFFNEMKDAQFDSKTKTLYATFVTAQNSIPGSAVCKFDIDEIHAKLQGPRITSESLSVNGTKPEEKELYSCSAQSKNYRRDLLRFLSETGVVKEPYRVEPILTIMRKNYRLDKIGVEQIDVGSVYATKPSVMMYISNNQGDLLKVRHNMSEGVTEWTEIQKVSTDSEDFSVSKILLDAETFVIITMTSGKVLQVPKSSCSLLTSCRSCLELGDPRCMWNSKPLDSSSSNACIYSTKYLTKDYWSTSKGNTVDSCPEEKVIALPVFIPPANTQTLKDTSRDSRTPVPIVPCTGKECDASGNIGDMSTVPADASAAVAAQQESASASKECHYTNMSEIGHSLNASYPGHLIPYGNRSVPRSSMQFGYFQQKWAFALIVAGPTFLVGLFFGMTTLFMYAYCKARGTRNDTNTTSASNMDDPEYGQDTNFYEPPPICAADHRNPNVAAQMKTSMAPQYFSHNLGRGAYAKDYDIIDSLSRQNSHNLMNSSLVINQQVMLNGMNGITPQHLGLMHHNASNGYLVGPVSGNGVSKAAPKVPPRPRNMSSYSTSSDGIDPTMDMTITSRTPNEDNRLVYQVPRGNNRFSNHEYEPGDIHFSTIPESETTPMLNQYSNESEQHSSLRRGQSMPRNGRFPDQHVEHALETNHSSLPRKVPAVDCKYYSPSSHYQQLNLPAPFSEKLIAESPVGDNPSYTEFPPPPTDLLSRPYSEPNSPTSTENQPPTFPLPEKNSTDREQGTNCNNKEYESADWIYQIPKVRPSKKGSTEGH